MQEFDQKSFKELQIKLNSFREKHNLSTDQVLELLKTEESLPVSIFNSTLSPLETVVKFLRENKQNSFREISLILNKKVSACWLAYKHSKTKLSKKFTPTTSKYDIPLDSLYSDKLSLLEVIVSVLRSRKLRYREIGQILHRDERTIWTSVMRAKQKNEN